MMIKKVSVGLLIIVLLAVTLECHKMVRNSQNEYFYLSFKPKPHFRALPDLLTVKALGFSEENVTVVEAIYLSDFKRLPEFKSLHLSEEQLKAPNEVMRARVSKVMILAPTTYVTNLYKVLQGLNPSIDIINGELFMAYREGVYNKPIQFAWLNKTTFEVMDMHSFMGLASGITAPIQKFNFNPIQEDPRLMVLPTTKQIYIQYTSKITIMTPPRPCYTVINTNGEQEITSSAYEDSILMDGYDHKEFGNSKNWVMFVFDDRIHFIQNINPMHVLAVKHTDPTTHTGTMEVIQRDTAEVALPWDAEYDPLIRGGTPMIPITTSNNTKLFVQFFHTVATTSLNVRTYYMGALTVCPTRPFRIHSMSRYPIIPRGSLYQGAWANAPIMDYVVFPTGEKLRVFEIMSSDIHDHVCCLGYICVVISVEFDCLWSCFTITVFQELSFWTP
jgi:hypothetical protein